MIRITVELVSAITGRTSLLGVGKISNDGKRSRDTAGGRGDYFATFSKRAPKQEETWKRGTVRDFDRVKRGAWDLLYLALRSAVGDRNE